MRRKDLFGRAVGLRIEEADHASLVVDLDDEGLKNVVADAAVKSSGQQLPEPRHRDRSSIANRAFYAAGQIELECVDPCGCIHV